MWTVRDYDTCAILVDPGGLNIATFDVVAEAHRMAGLLNRAQEMISALTAARRQFEFYATQHHAKGTPESTEKAVVNERMAAAMAAALGT